MMMVVDVCIFIFGCAGGGGVLVVYFTFQELFLLPFFFSHVITMAGQKSCGWR